MGPAPLPQTGPVWSVIEGGFTYNTGASKSAVTNHVRFNTYFSHHVPILALEDHEPDLQDAHDEGATHHLHHLDLRPALLLFMPFQCTPGVPSGHSEWQCLCLLSWPVL